MTELKLIKTTVKLELELTVKKLSVLSDALFWADVGPACKVHDHEKIEEMREIIEEVLGKVIALEKTLK